MMNQRMTTGWMPWVLRRQGLSAQFSDDWVLAHDRTLCTISLLVPPLTAPMRRVLVTEELHKVRPSVLISSSPDGRPLAEALQENLQPDCSARIAAENAFKLSHTAI